MPWAASDRLPSLLLAVAASVVALATADGYKRTCYTVYCIIISPVTAHLHHHHSRHPSLFHSSVQHPHLFHESFPLDCWYFAQPQNLLRGLLRGRYCYYGCRILSCFLSSFFLFSFSLSFFLLTPLSNQNLRSLLLRGNKCDRLETLMQCAEWSQITFQHIFGNMIHCKNN